MNSIRIDKFIWFVRLSKTRSDAAKSCEKGWILLNDRKTKSGKDVKINDIVSVKNKIIYRKYKVIQILKNRVGAKLVNDYIEEITPEEDLLKLKIANEFDKIGTPIRDKNQKGRPTKKERRELDQLNYK